MTSKIITISGKGMDIVERLLDGMESRGLIELFGLKFSGVTLETGVHAAEPFALMTAQEVAAVQPAPWSGDGLPPVGTVCEMTHSGWGDRGWGRVTINYCSSEYAITTDGNGEQHWHIRNITFRPIKTPAQIAAEEREAAVRELAGAIMGHAIGCRLPMSESGAERLADHLMMDGYTKTKREDQ